MNWALIAITLAFALCTSGNAHAQWTEQDVVQSELHAGRAQSLLEQGRRLPAIVEALKGLPSEMTDEDIPRFQLAYETLYRAVRSNGVALPLDGRAAGGMALSPDRSRVVIDVQFPDGMSSLELWDAQSGALITYIHEKSYLDPIDTYVFFSHDSHYIVSKANETHFQLHNARTGTLIGQRPLTDSWQGVSRIGIGSADFNHAMDRLVTVAAVESDIRVWSIPDLEPVLDDKSFAVGARYNTDYNKVTARFMDDTTLCVGAIFHDGQAFRDPNSKSSFKDIRLALMDARSGAHRQFYEIEKETIDLSGTSVVDCSPDGKLALLHYGDENAVPVFDIVDIETGVLVAHHHDFNLAAVAFHPTEPIAALIQWDRAVYLDLVSGEFSIDLPGAPIGYSPEIPSLYDIATGQPAGIAGGLLHYLAIGFSEIWDEYPSGTGLMEFARELIPAEEGQAAAPADVQSQDANNAEIWALRSGAFLAKGERFQAIAAALKGVPPEIDAESYEGAYSQAHDALYAAYRSMSQALAINEDMGSREILFAVTPDRSRAITMPLNAEGAYNLFLWDLTIEKPSPLQLDYDNRDSNRRGGILTISEDSRWLALPVEDGDVEIFDLKAGFRAARLNVAEVQPATQFSSGQPTVFALGFSPDHRFFTASGDYGPPANTRIVTRIWAVPDFEEVFSSETESRTVDRPVGVQFVEDNVICRRAPADRSGSGAFMLEAFDAYGKRRSYDLSGVVYPWHNIYNLACSPDLRWLYVHGQTVEELHDPEKTLAAQIINLETLEVVVEFDVTTAWRGAFSPDSAQFAVEHINFAHGWRYLDLATLQWNDNTPGVPESYRQAGAFLHDPANGNLVSYDIGLFVNYGAHLLWEDVPIGGDLVSAAFKVLPERLAREVEEEWGR
ncbi:WD40 repeat domain-containing protein [Aquamicrobium sp.]|uniref:WD40 repeat domain-containing protein n=1 Tax=Aquamicrobium sp. TaxID=1872579 RepID=UPI00258C0F04|nr:WD40 repeat domain-containing protein [Aquamicrobium sp.]MCK9549608.1 WD40 repeat domain-containing protein [Aquamicrobium sp.]